MYKNKRTLKKNNKIDKSIGNREECKQLLLQRRFIKMRLYHLYGLKMASKAFSSFPSVKEEEKKGKKIITKIVTINVSKKKEEKVL